MQVSQHALILANLISVGWCQVVPYIVDGHDASMINFPHAAFLSIKCLVKSGPMPKYVCGSSIVNQDLVLTAAHCTNECTEKSSITVYVGHEVRYAGAASTAHSFLYHVNYHARKLHNDICLVRLKTVLQFSAKINRVALLEDPPYDEEAVVSGWGMYDESVNRFSDKLQYAKQHLKGKKYCRSYAGHAGTICTDNKEGYAARGDSGSALVVRNYVQIGIVSYVRLINSDEDRLVFYSDTGYYYDWINEKSQTIMCP